MYCRTDENSHAPLEVACQRLDVAVEALLYTLKKAKKPSRQCDELSGSARGSCSEVWALRVDGHK